MGDPPPEIPYSPPPGSGNGQEHEVVETWRLTEVLRSWISEYDAQHRSVETGQNRYPGVVYGPVELLAEKSGINARRISTILAGGTRHTGLSIADALLMAIGRPDFLSQEGEIPTMKNPAWSMESYMAYMQERGCI